MQAHRGRLNARSAAHETLGLIGLAYHFNAESDTWDTCQMRHFDRTDVIWEMHARESKKERILVVRRELPTDVRLPKDVRLRFYRVEASGSGFYSVKRFFSYGRLFLLVSRSTAEVGDLTSSFFGLSQRRVRTCEFRRRNGRQILF